MNLFYQQVESLLKISEIRKSSQLFGAEKSEFPDIPENWWNKRKDKGKEETNKKKNKIIKVSCFINLALNQS